jgi:hypothetical protein
MAAEEISADAEQLLAGLRRLQAEYGEPVADAAEESPAAALDSLQDAVVAAPTDYRAYLEEALQCYRAGLYRAAILMVWAAVVQHLYSAAAAHHGGITAFQRANQNRFGTSPRYRQIKKQADFLYMGERDFIQLGEDAGMYNRNIRKLLYEKLELRNLCGHPTKYTPGRRRPLSSSRVSRSTC